eukprot:XP_001692659.1 flagellar associated protein [Chlamydomonas reinhardtii]
MAPKDAAKGKKKKKTKEELEEERRQAEEAARLAEEERLRAEEAERQRLAELERQRLELLGQFLDAEKARLDAQLSELDPLLRQFEHERSRSRAAAREAAEWERFLRCVDVPHPRQRVPLAEFLRRPDGRDLRAAFLAVEWAEALESDLRTLYGIVNARIDRLTAAVLHHCDEYANDKNEIQLGHAVEMPQLGVTLEIPKQIALANIALRVQQRSGPGVDEYFSRCANAWMAVGGLLAVDLLAMPPGAKKVRGWTLRQVTPLALNVQRVPYPIPPAGADPATWASEEEPPPLGDPLQVACDVAFDGASKTFSFHTTHLAPLALVMRRTRLLPYAGWAVRPTGGRNGNGAAISLDVGLDAPVVIELASLIGQPMPPLDLLQRRVPDGLQPLEPDRGTGGGAGTTVRGGRGAVGDRAVTDWEEGGRTAPHHLARIFDKEKEDGERRVLVVMRRGAKGVAFSDALNRRPEYPALPGVGSVEAVKECELSIWGEVHASVLTLLRGQFSAPGAADSPLALRLAAAPESLELCRTTSPLFTATLADTMLALRLFSFS